MDKRGHIGRDFRGGNRGFGVAAHVGKKPQRRGNFGNAAVLLRALRGEPMDDPRRVNPREVKRG